MRLFQLIVRTFQASPSELSFRISQAISKNMLRFSSATFSGSSNARKSLQSLSVEENSLSGWFSRRNQPWFLNETRVLALEQHFTAHPACWQEKIDHADSLVDNRMRICGHGMVDFRGAARWHRDHIHRITAPNKFYDDIAYLDAIAVGDSKHVWEPNRFGWVYCLGSAYIATGDQRYVDIFCKLTRDWFVCNPYPYGINYCSSLEIAIRCYAWVWACDLFKDAIVDDAKLLGNMVEGIWLGARHIEKYLSYYFAPNTHLIGEAFSLFAIGSAFPEFSESQRWRELGNKILSAESSKQFYTDGTHRELSSCYHLYSTDFYVQTILISQQTGFPVDKAVEETALRSAIRLAQLAPADLQMPQFNDCDGGRLTWFCDEPLNAEPTLSAAKHLWDHPSFPSQDSLRNGYHLWMCQQGDVESNTTTDSTIVINSDKNERLQSNKLPDSGITAYHTKAGDYLLFRSGPFGYMDCGHSHDAPTSFILHFAGRPLFVDCGTGSYTVSKEIRDRFRSAIGKNTLLVDGKGPSLPGDWFNWEHKSNAVLTKAKHFPGGFLCQGHHEAFSHVHGFQIEISRQIVLYDDGILVIADQWRAEQPISCSLPLTLHPNVTPQVTDQGADLQDTDGSLYRMVVHRVSASSGIIAGPSLLEKTSADRSATELAETFEPPRSLHAKDTPENLPVRLKFGKGPYSTAYGVVSETNVLECDFGTSLEGSVLTIISRAGNISSSAKNDRQSKATFTVRMQGSHDHQLLQSFEKVDNLDRVVAMVV